MITGICMVLFSTVFGQKQVNMSAQEFAHLVYTFKRKKASCFKEEFTYTKDGKTFEYKGFGLRRRFGKGFTLEYSVE